MKDADKTTSIKPDWPKGYSRKGAALHGLNRLDEAMQAYKKGLEFDPENILLKRGVSDIQAAQAANSNPIAKLFGPDIWTNMATNPKLKPYLDQPEIIQKIQAIQANPGSVNQYMNVCSHPVCYCDLMR